MYVSMTPMSADYKGPAVDEKDEEVEGASVLDQDVVDTSEGEEETEEEDTEETEVIPRGKRPRVFSDSDESNDPAVDVQGTAAAPILVAPLRAAPPAPKRPKTDFAYALNLSS